MDGLAPAPLLPPDHPAAIHGLVQRHVLFRRLAAVPPGGVAVVEGPAGSGKTVLVQSWVETDCFEDRAAWVSIERGERDAARFWRSVVDGLARATTGDDAVAWASPSPGLRINVPVERLVSDLDSLSKPTLLVIDDLNELDSPEAMEGLELLLEQLPRSLRVALLTREDPRLRLHRLRLSGRLTEIRAFDLRFDLEETRELLEGAGISLGDEGVALLHERTEGWVAGLRLAAISLAKHPDPERFVTEFSGSERTVAGYLLAEVLEHQPPEVRELLLRTSILERVTGPLSDALTGGAGSERVLQQLEDQNAFVTSLDACRTWFRYHHMFADLLQLQLRSTAPGIIDSLHRAAARWYEEHGYSVDAVRHAQASQDWRHAARLLADSYIDLALDGRRDTLRELFAGFPGEAPMHDADLAVAIAGASLYGGQVKDAAAYIELAQDLASTVPEERRWRFDLGVGATRLSLARRRADVEAALEAMGLVEDGLAAQPASELGRGSEYRSAALMNLGIAELWALRTTDALRHLEEALALARRLDRPCLEIGCLSYLALARPLAGESLQDGLRLAEQAIEVAETHGWAFDAISAPAFAIAGLELVWLGRLDEAGRLLARADDLLIADSEPVLELAVRYASGLVRFAEGRLEEALAAFREAESMSALLSHDVLTIDPKAWTLQVQALLGDGEPARAALSELTDEERDRSGIRIADTAIHLAQQQPAQAVEALVPLIERRGHAVEQPCVAVTALLFEAAAHDKLCERNAAETSLERALELAEPDGILLPFLVAPVRGLLERHPRHRTAHATLLATVLDLLGGSPRSLNGRPPPALEELSEAELRVLRYLAGNLKAPEIASELCVSPNTVRTHLRHIYAKLGAHSRSEAVTRARELRLLGFSTTRH